MHTSSPGVRLLCYRSQDRGGNTEEGHRKEREAQILSIPPRKKR